MNSNEPKRALMSLNELRPILINLNEPRAKMGQNDPK